MTAYGREKILDGVAHDEVRFSMQRLRIVGYHAESTGFGMLAVTDRNYTTWHVAKKCVDPSTI